MSIYKQLTDARLKFHTLKLTKTGLNKFANYTYFELADFLIPALKVMAEFDLCAYISFGKDMATMRIVSNTDGSFIELTSPMAEAQLKGCHPIQNLGAVQSYLRRYLWVAAMEIVEHDAIDSSQPVEKITAKAPVIPACPNIELSQEDEEFLNGMAGDVTGMCVDGQSIEALQMIRAASLDGDQQIALNNMLNSKVRAALKKAKESIQQTKETA